MKTLTARGSLQFARQSLLCWLSDGEATRLQRLMLRSHNSSRSTASVIQRRESHRCEIESGYERLVVRA